jgi:hypothetical protein
MDERLCRGILTRWLVGGETLVEGRLAATMGVSRTLLRQARGALWASALFDALKVAAVGAHCRSVGCGACWHGGALEEG